MKPAFLLFAYFHYYPSGGMDDLVGVFDSFEGAMAAGEASGLDEYDILDTSNLSRYFTRHTSDVRERFVGSFGYKPNGAWIQIK